MRDNWLRPFRPLAGDLPIFRQDCGPDVLFYAPGYLAVAEQTESDDLESTLLSSSAQQSIDAVVYGLIAHAEAAQQYAANLVNQTFAPLCLTLYLSNACNLTCSYCFSMAAPTRAQRLTPHEIEDAARVVASNCVAYGKPLTVVFHGGGEPSLDGPLLHLALETVERVAAQSGLDCFRYIATNGVMSSTRAHWLADHFDLIGLSCDGPAAIQAAQRPRYGGGDSTQYLLRTARIVREAGKPLHVRVTVTPSSFERQAKIAEYICQTIQPQAINVESVYQLGRASYNAQAIDDPGGFVTHFLAARAVAVAYGVEWRTSGSRPAELHGPYCNLFRNVLNLVPGGAATACFTDTTMEQATEHQCAIAHADSSFHIDEERVQQLRKTLAVTPPGCQTCFNRFHCTYSCPDWCPIDRQLGIQPSETYGCAVRRMLVTACLQETAKTLRATRPDGFAGGEVLL